MSNQVQIISTPSGISPWFEKVPLATVRAHDRLSTAPRRAGMTVLVGGRRYGRTVYMAPPPKGLSPDKRKRRRQHRIVARNLLQFGGFDDTPAQRGSTMHDVAMWHLHQARYFKR